MSALRAGNRISGFRGENRDVLSLKLSSMVSKQGRVAFIRFNCRPRGCVLLPVLIIFAFATTEWGSQQKAHYTALRINCRRTNSGWKKCSFHRPKRPLFCQSNMRSPFRNGDALLVRLNYKTDWSVTNFESNWLFIFITRFGFKYRPGVVVRM